MNNKIVKTKKRCPKTFKRAFGVREIAQGIWGELKVSDSFLYLYRRFGTPCYDTNDEYKIAYEYNFWYKGLYFVVHGSTPEFVYLDCYFPNKYFVLQRSIEKAAFKAGGGGFIAPAQRVGDFLEGRASVSFGEILPSYRPGTVPADLRAVLPAWMVEDLKKGIRAMNAQLSGFANPDAVLTGPETRSSSPVRIVRNALGEAEDFRGLYPVGEGAGYAGGIVSAAADGITAALKAIEKQRLL